MLRHGRTGHGKSCCQLSDRHRLAGDALENRPSRRVRKNGKLGVSGGHDVSAGRLVLAAADYHRGHRVGLVAHADVGTDRWIVVLMPAQLVIVGDGNDSYAPSTLGIGHRAEDDSGPGVGEALPVRAVRLHRLAFLRGHVDRKSRPGRNKPAEKILHGWLLYW